MSTAPSDRTLRTLGWVNLVVCLVAFAIAVGLVAVDPRISGPFAYDDMVDPYLAVVILLFPTVGAFITRQQPRNRIGWLLHASAWPWALTALVDAYSRITFHISPGSLPAGDVVELIGSELWWPGVVIPLVFVPLFFPDGKLPSPGWKWLVWVSSVVVVVGVFLFSTVGGEASSMLEPVKSNPIDLGISRHVADQIGYVLVPIAPLSVLAAVASLVVRFRRAVGVERLQLKWLLATIAVIGTLYTSALVLGLFGHGDGRLANALSAVMFAALGLVPITIGIAITRHGLYGIDTLISRALMVGALGVFITGVYVGIVVGVGALIGQQHPSVALSVLATAVVAVAFQPMREWVTRIVNRLVYGQRATPYEVLSDFAETMSGRFTTAELLPRLAHTVSDYLGGARVEVWRRSGQILEQEAAWPTTAAVHDAMVMASPDRLADLPGEHVLPVRHRDELLGALVVTKPSSEPMTPSEEEMLVHVSSQTGLVLRNCGLVEDLQDSRARLVTSQDAQRRRLERDLHDGAQQNLVAIALMLRMATNQTDPQALSRSAVEAADALQSAIAELRELARGLHPAILTDRGLVPALTSVAERSPVPVHLDTRLSRRLPGPVEGALYFVAAESLTNVAKYAQATQVTVTLTDHRDHVTLQVVDDGVGGADPSRGSGLLGLADRVSVVDGTFTVHSPPGEGTTTRCEVPVPVGVPARRQQETVVPAGSGGA